MYLQWNFKIIKISKVQSYIEYKILKEFFFLNITAQLSNKKPLSVTKCLSPSKTIVF
jgi:hypothetical protein